MQIFVSGASAGLLYQGGDVAVVDLQALIQVDMGPPTLSQQLQDNWEKLCWLLQRHLLTYLCLSYPQSHFTPAI